MEQLRDKQKENDRKTDRQAWICTCTYTDRHVIVHVHAFIVFVPHILYMHTQILRYISFALFNCFLLLIIDHCSPLKTDQSTMLKSRVGALLVRPCSNVALLCNHDNKELKEDVDGCVEVGGCRVGTRSVQLPYMFSSFDFCI